MWDEERNNHMFTPAALNLARPLLDLVIRHDMYMALPKDVPTLWASNEATSPGVDNIFCTQNLVNRIIECDAHPNRTPSIADHFPILAVIDIAIDTGHFEPWQNFRLTDWEAFRELLAGKLAPLAVSKVLLVDDFDDRLRELEAVMKEVIALHVPLARECPYTKRWWDKGFGQAKAGHETGCAGLVPTVEQPPRP